MIDETFSDLIMCIECCIFDAGIDVAKSIDKYDEKKLIMESHNDTNDTIEIISTDDVFQEADVILKQTNRMFPDEFEKEYKDKFLSQFKYDFKQNSSVDRGELNRKMAEALLIGWCASEHAKNREKPIKLRDLRYIKENRIALGYTTKDAVNMFIIDKIDERERKDDSNDLAIHDYGIVDFGDVPDDPNPNLGLIRFYVDIPKKSVTDEILRDYYASLKARKLDRSYKSKDNHTQDENDAYKKDYGFFDNYVKQSGCESLKDAFDKGKKAVEKIKSKTEWDPWIVQWHTMNRNGINPKLKQVIGSGKKRVPKKDIDSFNDIDRAMRSIASYFDIRG